MQVTDRAQLTMRERACHCPPQVSAFGGDSLFGAFTKSISANLANFPQAGAAPRTAGHFTGLLHCWWLHSETQAACASSPRPGAAWRSQEPLDPRPSSPQGPALTDEFWVLMITW